MATKPALGIDLGGTNCRGALVWPDGSVNGWRQISTPRELGPAELFETLAAFCREFIPQRHPAAALSAVGIGIPGVVDATGRIGLAPNLPALDRMALGALLSESLGLPITVVNDANAAAWGEAVAGNGRDLDSLVLITLGTGIGSGLVLQRRLWCGATGAAGEIGHLPVVPDGRRCGCGSRGCLETYASVSGLLRTVREGLAGGALSVLSSAGEFDGAALARAAVAGDSLACHAYELAGTTLGQALAGVVNLLNPEALIFSGGGAAALELLQPALERELRQRCVAPSLEKLQLRRGALGDHAGVIGAARLATASVSA